MSRRRKEPETCGAACAYAGTDPNDPERVWRCELPPGHGGPHVSTNLTWSGSSSVAWPQPEATP